MSLGHSLVLGHRLRLEEFGLWSLPRAAELLAGDAGKAAICHAAGRRNVDKYSDLVDFVLCEVCHDYKPGCFAYYRDEGPKLDKLLTPEQLEALDAYLVSVIAVAVARHRRGEKQNWTAFRAEVLRICSRAGTPCGTAAHTGVYAG